MPEKIVFRPILPKNPNYFDDIAKEITGELAAAMLGPVARTLIKAEEAYIDNWDHKPKIVSQFTHQKTQLKLLVTPFGKDKRYWAFVSLGTKGKGITPIHGPYLKVREGYLPKTAPSGVYGGPGTYSGGNVYLPSVKWPGIKPRHFEEHIVDKFGDTVILQLGIAFEKVIKKFG